MDIIQFNDLVIPLILQDIPAQNYYIKGGKCYDAYFQDTTNSKDWDLVADEKTVNYVINRMTEYGKKLDIEVQRRDTSFPNIEGDDEPMVQLGFQDYSIDGDPFLLDIIVRNEELIHTTINKLNYMPLLDFVKDIIITYDNRANMVYNYVTATSKDAKNPIIKEVNDFNQKYEQKMDIFTESCQTLIENTRKQFINYIKSNALPKVREVYIDFMNKIQEFNDYNQDNCIEEYINIYSEYKDDEDREIEDMWDEIADKTKNDDSNFSHIQDFISEYFSDIITNWDAYRKNVTERNPLQGKYEKTSRRIGNVIDISWDNLSNSYKKYLMSECQNKEEISLFNMGDTCNAYLKCKPQYVVKRNTTKCIKTNLKHSELGGRYP
jgi:hypothetical protein